MNSSDFKAWRERVGLTQAAVASKFGVTRATVINWENSGTELAPAIEANCQIWERRLRQVRPDVGPVTLVYADAPMFVNPYGPMRRPAMMQQEPYATNADACARVRQLTAAGAESVCNPFIMEPDGHDLWNITELARLVRGDDKDAPLWRKITVAKASREEVVADSNVKAMISACIRAYSEKRLPRDVIIYRDLSVADDYVYLFSPMAFALDPDEIRKCADSIVFCDAPDPATSGHKKIEF